EERVLAAGQRGVHQVAAGRDRLVVGRRGVLEAGQLDRRQALLGGGEHHVDACGRRELHHAHEGRVRLLVGGGRGGGDDRGRGAGVVGRVVGGAFGRVRVLGRVGPVLGRVGPV